MLQSDEMPKFFITLSSLWANIKNVIFYNIIVLLHAQLTHATFPTFLCYMKHLFHEHQQRGADTKRTWITSN